VSDATAEFDIDRIADGGDGVGRVDGLVVFVPRTAPGDRVVARLTTKRGGRFARGTVLSLARASAARVEPPCVHYTRDRCGGCQLQHLSYPAQLDAKRHIVRDALERIGKRHVELPEIRESPSPWRYRRKLTLALRRGATGEWIAGLHAWDDPGAVFPVDDCLITDERVVAIWREVMAAAGHLPDAPALRASVRADGTRFALMVEGGAGWTTHQRFFDAVPSLSTLWWASAGPPRRLHERVADPGGDAADASFTQVNASVAAALRAHVVALALAHAPATAIDAYAGTGDTAAALAASGVRVTAIERDAHAAAVCASRLPAGSTSLAGSVETHLAARLPGDVIILNPPRTGVDARVTAALEAVRPAPRAILYVSCDPATLARDVARLPGFRIASLLAFDMFPQTAHVETVCALEPEAA
jgi:23S rRNA (uracil1939-C5)-methyltransferase